MCATDPTPLVRVTPSPNIHVNVNTLVPGGVALKCTGTPTTGLLVSAEGPLKKGPMLLATVKGVEALAPPPGVGFVTEIAVVPTNAMYAAGTLTVSCVPVTLVGVKSAWPTHLTTDDAMKLVPVSVSVIEPPPATAAVGAMLLRVGTGFDTNGLIVNVCDELVPPPGVGFATVIAAVPADAMYAAGTLTVTNVPLTVTGVKSACPAQLTTDEAMKFVPVSVSVNNAPPAVAETGTMVASVGAGLGLAVVNDCDELGPPPGAGFVTVIAAVPAEAK